MRNRGATDATARPDDAPSLDPARRTLTDTERVAPSHQEIASLAYSYWEARGRHGGSSSEDWFRAEEELKRRQQL